MAFAALLPCTKQNSRCVRTLAIPKGLRYDLICGATEKYTPAGVFPLFPRSPGFQKTRILQTQFPLVPASIGDGRGLEKLCVCLYHVRGPHVFWGVGGSNSRINIYLEAVTGTITARISVVQSKVKHIELVQHFACLQTA